MFFPTHSLPFTFKSESTYDEWGQQASAEIVKTFADCLVSPLNTEDKNFPDLNFDETFVRVDIARTFTDRLANASVKFPDSMGQPYAGRIFKVVGDAVSFDAPLFSIWNRYAILREVSGNESS